MKIVFAFRKQLGRISLIPNMKKKIQSEMANVPFIIQFEYKYIMTASNKCFVTLIYL